MRHIETIAGSVSALLCMAAGLAQQVNWWPMQAGIHPVLDGQATSPLPRSPGAPPNTEWAAANNVMNLQNDGVFRAEWQRDWDSQSGTGNHQMYNGVTLFNMHDITGYRTRDLADYNTFEYSLGNFSVRGWVFANDDDSNDAAWVANSGLGANYANGVDDRGFIVRLNDNPNSDYHWLPGMLMPGDPGFNWNLSYGFFGTAGFNNSTWVAGLPANGGGPDNEVYEVALYGQSDVWLNATGGTGFTPCVTTITVTACDPAGGQPAGALQVKIAGPGHVNVLPEPGVLMFMAAAGLVCARRSRSL